MPRPKRRRAWPRWVELRTRDHGPGWKSRHTRLRFWVISHFHNYLVYYERREEVGSIERVLDGRRDVRRIVEDGIEHPPPED